jgi:hypothetical protein
MKDVLVDFAALELFSDFLCSLCKSMLTAAAATSCGNSLLSKGLVLVVFHMHSWE